ncbi:MAG: Gfo/Idh/MocA family protein [Nocardioidaceae bacterium]
MSGPLRAGLIGAGAMGRHHARVLRGLPDVDLVVVADPGGDPYGVVGSASLVPGVEAVVATGIDLCVVATPTYAHVDVGLALAEAGIATLIEKPLASTFHDARQLEEAFDKAGVLGCVGHVERYNPALLQMRRRLAAGELGSVYQVITRRQGPYPARIGDVGVVMDLATHDVDLTAWVTQQPYRDVSARTAHRSGREHEDLVAVVGSLADGTVVNHLVNWLSPMKERITVVTGERGCLVADTLSADLTFYANGAAPVQWDTFATFRGVVEGDMVRYAFPKAEPLATELAAFCDAVRGGRAETVTMREAVTTVEVAERLLESARSGDTVSLDDSRRR